jgi:hypothetical protein
MSVEPSAEKLDEVHERQRLLALLALTSQELPHTQRDSRGLHDYLDANVEAFEALIVQHRADRAAQSARKTRFAMRLAASIAAFAILTAIVLTVLPGREEPLQVALDRSYAELADRIGAAGSVESGSSNASMPAQLGFSSAQRASAASSSFAAGVADGKARLTQSNAFVAQRQSDDRYYILGQWNVLLSAAVRGEQPAAFWVAQREFGRRLVTELDEASGVDEQAVSHLQKLDTMLAALAARGSSARTAYELAKEVELFRAQLAPGVDRAH